MSGDSGVKEYKLGNSKDTDIQFYKVETWDVVENAEQFRNRIKNSLFMTLPVEDILMDLAEAKRLRQQTIDDEQYEHVAFFDKEIELREIILEEHNKFHKK